MPKKLLISACLLGQPVRYDGQSKPLADMDWLESLRQQNRLYILCPEVAGGLPTPRPPAERLGDVIATAAGQDVSEAFALGAQKALALCLEQGIEYALLKAKSPSCGNAEIYDGSFSNRLTPGMGVTAQLLSEHGVTVFSELQIAELKAVL